MLTLLCLLLLSFLLSTLTTLTSAGANATLTQVTDPADGIPLQNTSLGHGNDAAFTLTAFDSGGSLAGDGEHFTAELWSKDGCRVGWASTACQVTCYPRSSEAHDIAAQCLSSGLRDSQYSRSDSHSSAWSVARVSSEGGSEYRIDYSESVEVTGSHTVHVYHLQRGGLRGSYFDNVWMAGDPSKTQVDGPIYFDWARGAVSRFGSDYVSVRWEGHLRPPTNETYTIHLTCDDGCRLWIDQQLVIDSWSGVSSEQFGSSSSSLSNVFSVTSVSDTGGVFDSGLTAAAGQNSNWASLRLDASTFHSILLEYREIRGDASVRLEWESGSIPRQTVSSDYLWFGTEVPIANSTDGFIVRFDEGNVSVSKAIIQDTSVFDETHGNLAGQNITAVLKLFDPFGNIITEDRSNEIDVSDLDGEPSEIIFLESDDNGESVYEYHIVVIGFTKGVQRLQVNVSEQPMEGSPFEVYIHSDIVTSVNNSLVSGLGLSSATAGITGSFNFTAVDLYGNYRDSCDPDSSSSSDGSCANDEIISVFETTNVNNNNNGEIEYGHSVCEYIDDHSEEGLLSYQCTYTLTYAPALYTHYLTINGDDYWTAHLPSLNVSSGLTHGPSSTIEQINCVSGDNNNQSTYMVGLDYDSGSSLTISCVAGWEISMVIQSRDQFGNPSEGWADGFTLNAYNMDSDEGSSVLRYSNALESSVLTPLGNGEYQLNLTDVTLKGVFQVKILFENETQIHTSIDIFTVEIKAGLIIDSNQSVIVDSNGQPTTPDNMIQAGVMSSLWIETKDEFGNLFSNGDERFRDSDTNVTLFLRCNVETGGSLLSAYNQCDEMSSVDSGRYQCDFTPTVSGLECSLSIEIDGLNISDSIFDGITVKPGIPDASQSVVLSAPNNMTAGLESMVIVQAKDAYGNDIDDSDSSNYWFSVYLVSSTILESSQTTIDTSDDNSVISASEIIDHRNGQYTAKITIKQNNVAEFDKFQIKLTQNGGLKATYFDDFTFSNAYSTDVIDSIIDFNWGSDGPSAFTDDDGGDGGGDSISDFFSVIWRGMLKVDHTEVYTFYIPREYGTGVQLLLDNIIIIDEWEPFEGSTLPFSRQILNIDQMYPLEFRLREYTGDCIAQLQWEASITTEGQRKAIQSRYLFYDSFLGNLEYQTIVGGQTYYYINSNVTVYPSYSDPSNTQIDNDTLNTLITNGIICGELGILKFSLFDSYGNRQTNEGDQSSSMTAYITFETLNNQTVIHNEGTAVVITADESDAIDGQYTITFNVTNSTDQTVRLHLKLNGIYLSGFPLIFDVYPASLNDLTSTVIINDGIHNGILAGDQVSAIMILRDAFGNLCNCGDQTSNPVSIVFEFTHSDDSSNIVTYSTLSSSSKDEITGNYGIFELTFNFTQTGVYYPSTITVNGTDLDLTNVAIPANLTIDPAVVDPAQSYILDALTPQSWTFNAGQSISERLRMVDIFGNDIDQTTLLSRNEEYKVYSRFIDTDSNEEVLRCPVIIDVGSVLGDGTVMINCSVPSESDRSYLWDLELTSERSGLKADYYHNRWIHGSSVKTEIFPNLTQIWDTFDGELITDSARNYISIRMTGFIQASFAERYNFTVFCDDGISLSIDGEKIIDEFLNSVTDSLNGDFFEGYFTFLNDSMIYPITIDYRQNTGNASFEIGWESSSDPFAILNSDVLYPEATPILLSPFTVDIT